MDNLIVVVLFIEHIILGVCRSIVLLVKNYLEIVLQWIIENTLTTRHDYRILSLFDLGPATPAKPASMRTRIILILRFLILLPLSTCIWRISWTFYWFIQIVTSIPLINMFFPSCPYPDAPRLSRVWLQTTLQRKGLLGAWNKIVNLKQKRVPNSCYGVIQYRILIDYADNSSPKLPRSLILRQNHLSLFYRYRHLCACWYRESYFLRDNMVDSNYFASDKFMYNKGLLPGVVWSFAWPWRDYICIIQDLDNERGVVSYKDIAQNVEFASKEFIGSKLESRSRTSMTSKSISMKSNVSGRMQGVVTHSTSDMDSMIPPAYTYSILGKSYTIQEMVVVCMQDMAKLHSQYWRDSKLIFQSKYKLRGGRYYAGTWHGYIAWEAQMASLRRHWTELKRCSKKNAFKIPTRLRHYVDETLSRSSWDEFDYLIKTSPFTFIYGNTNLEDMYLAANDCLHLKLTSWHVCGVGHPCIDLVNILIWLPTDVLKRYMKAFLNAYIDKLVEMNVMELDTETLFKMIKPRVDCTIADLILDGHRYVQGSSRQLEKLKKRIDCLYRWIRLYQSDQTSTVMTNIVSMC